MKTDTLTTKPETPAGLSSSALLAVKGGLTERGAAVLDEMFDEYLLDKARQQGVSLDKAQELLLKIAKQMQEIERLNALLKAERNRSNELTDRWAQVRTECGALTDDSVWEVLERIRRQRMTANNQAEL